MGIYQGSQPKILTALTIYNWVIITLLIAGWFVSAGIARSNRKKNDRTNLIDKKNEMLRDLQEQSFYWWSEEGVAHITKKEFQPVISLIERVRDTYQELESVHLIPMPPAANRLRRAITLHIDSNPSPSPQALAKGRDAILKLIKELESVPPKKF